MSSITVDGTAVPFVAGQSVAGALVADGRVAWRRTHHEGRPRGLFCGIGVCFDCLLEVDGVPGVRGCLTPATDGMVIRTRSGGDDE